jgi:hypothetical protein
METKQLVLHIEDQVKYNESHNKTPNANKIKAKESLFESQGILLINSLFK